MNRDAESEYEDFYIGDGVVPGHLASEHPKVIATLRRQAPEKAAAIFAGLLGCPELQSSCVRLEALVHLSLLHGKGRKSLTASEAQACWVAMGAGQCGVIEDPPEDVFVANVSTPFGNARVLEGLWESGGYYLQRVLDMLYAFENPERLTPVGRSIEALLKLSDAFCGRSHLTRWQIGEDQRAERIPLHLVGRIREIAQRAVFSFDDLSKIGVDLEDLAPFAFGPNQIGEIEVQPCGHTSLERAPLLVCENEVVLALPTAVSSAIRRFLVETYETRLGDGWTLNALTAEYERHLSQMPWLGERVPHGVKFQKVEGIPLLSAALEVDTGRYLNTVFVVDTMRGFNETGLTGVDERHPGRHAAISRAVELAYNSVSARTGFRSMITVIVVCGIGRSVSLDRLHQTWPGHLIQHMRASDFALLSQSGQFRALKLWRILEGQERLLEHGVELFNFNGILNLIAWVDELEGNLVPHIAIKAREKRAERIIVRVEQSAIRKIRCKILLRMDPHRLRDVDGHWKPVMRSGHSYFESDNLLPLYHGCDQASARDFSQIVPTGSYSVWSTVLSAGQRVVPFEQLYGWCEILRTWLPRMATFMDSRKVLSSHSAILLRLEVEAFPEAEERNPEALDYKAALDHLVLTAEGAMITIRVRAGFERAIGAPTNLAERAVVRRIVEGICLCGGSEDEPIAIEHIVDDIIPNEMARQSHRFVADSFRDRVRPASNERVVNVDPIDSGGVRVGLGWRARKFEDGCRIEGREACRDYLRAVERELLDDVRCSLVGFDRCRLIHDLMLNHERAAADRSRWQRTAAAIEALHDGDDSVREVIVKRHYELNGVFQASRALIEMAVCEAPLEGGFRPGALDIARLMATIQMALHLGGAADAIHFKAMVPELEITSFGDINLNYGFHQGIVEPHAAATTNALINEAIGNYAGNYAGAEDAFSGEGGDNEESVPRAMELEFLVAFEAELGVSLQEACVVVDYLEDLALLEGTPVVEKRLSELLDVKTDGGTVSVGKAAKLIANWTLSPRTSWRALEQGVEEGDLHISQFRRRFAMLARPLIQVDHDEDPRYLLAPGMVREAFVYQLRHYHQADYREGFLRSAEMRAWKARQDGIRGATFEQMVAECMKEAGWNVRKNVPLAEIFGRNLGRDYGDIDVLAWNAGSWRVLVLECKDIAFRQAPGELAEQLKRFQGEIDERGKRDLLLKHLDRARYLAADPGAVSNFCNLPRAKIEHAIVFKNPVPMAYAAASLSEKTHVVLMDDLPHAFE